MRIQFNINKKITINEKDQSYLRSLISSSLEVYESDIVELKVHLSDENEKRTASNAMQCLLDTEVKNGIQPLPVSCKAENIVLAILIALDKLTFSLEAMFMRLKNPKISFMTPQKLKLLAAIPVLKLQV
ncbi:MULTISPECIES: hypothetical protein [Winogradskyella]|uniref:hypothetical protein n=1 Tax=Winogradskyella TaxID=286104 RepID=UPI0015C74955|nr:MULTISPECIES: hypothetical protein [Winogradskyella]QXP79338.1 hypothetical protein H0I32_01410 [Winogradskyella sp. HaHa_3_26]